MKKLFIFFFTLVVGVGIVFADAVQIGYLYYNLIDENKTAEVTSSGVYKYFDTVVIPASVTYNAQAYKYTYSLSKDERNNTVVKTLLTIR